MRGSGMVITVSGKPLIEPYSIYIPQMTFERLLEFADEDLACELLDGVIVIHSPASFLHESIFQFLTTMLKVYGEKYSLGIPIGSRFVMKLSNKWAPEPDVIFLTPKDQANVRETFLDGPGTAVFEILSPSNRKEDLNKKLPQYLQHGVSEVWIIDPSGQSITIHGQGESQTFADADWAESRAIKGFKIKPAWLWKPNSITVLDALLEIGK